jgi:hypothetical protein
MNRKHIFLAIAAMTIAGSALAISSHYVRGPFASLDTPGVNVTWKEAGLGNDALVEYRADATGSARYQCVNSGNRCPAASNKQSVTGNISAYGAFSSGKNGAITGALHIDPPAATLSCPPGQHRVLTAASFTNISLSDLTNGPSYVATDPNAISFAGPECP